MLLCISTHGRQGRPLTLCGQLERPAALGQVQQAANHVALSIGLPVAVPPRLVHLPGRKEGTRTCPYLVEHRPREAHTSGAVLIAAWLPPARMMY